MTALVDRQIATSFDLAVLCGMKALRRFGWSDEQIAELYACSPMTVLCALGAEPEAREEDGHGAA